MKRVSIIGSGNIGTNAAFFIAENGTAPVCLVDVKEKEGMPIGKALDLMEAGPIRRYDTAITGTSEMKSISSSDVVVVAAGRVRKPGESRMDLYPENSQVVKAICASIKEYAPNAVVVNVSEPVDPLTLLIQETLGFDRKRVLGVGGLLSSTRLRYLVSKALGISPRDVSALVVGPHQPSMVVFRDSVRVSGIPAAKLLGEERLSAIIEEVREAGDVILEESQRSTSYYAPSAAVAEVVRAIVRNTGAILPVSLRLDGEYGLKDVCVSVPAQVGEGGVKRVFQVDLGEDGKSFRSAADGLRTAMASARGKGARN
jgi:malate dehydrogenase